MKLLLIILGTVMAVPFSYSQSKNQAKPKLVVGIVVDQMCYDYLYRYEKKFSSKGFMKLMQGGTHCRNAHYNYVPTYTGPGHASIYTGATPADHGIIANEWYVRELDQEVNCVGDKQQSTVGSTSKEGQCSPKNLYAMTITDQLKLTYPNAKVLSVSIKNRSAILPAGHAADGAYWFDYSNGHFITSSFYKDQLPEWVTKFNDVDKVSQYLEQSWNTLKPLGSYTESGPDNSPYELVLKGKSSPEFPYDLKAMLAAGASKDIFTATPFANTLLTDFAIAGLRSEALGQDEHTDFLAISYSSPDIAGHAFGPYSVELEDMYLRLDLELEKLIDVLESRVGKDQFVLFLTADHAVVPVPQQLVDLKMPGGYVFEDQLIQKLEQELEPLYSDKLILSVSNNQVYLNQQLINERQCDASMIGESIRDILMRYPGVKAVYTKEDLRVAPRDKWMQMVSRGFREQLSGDVTFLLESGYLMKNKDDARAHKGTSHGSAFSYDTQVPLIWYGKQIPQQNIDRRVEITDIAPSLSIFLQVQQPGMCNGQPIVELWHK